MIRRLPSLTLGADRSTPSNGLNNYYRVLLRRLRSAQNRDASPHTIGVTSSARGEGVSTVAINTAVCSARDLDQLTLLIDASDSQTAANRVFDVGPGPGLSDVLFRSVEPCEYIHESNVEHLYVMGLGATRETLHATFDEPRAREFFAQLKRAFQCVLVDLPTATDLTVCSTLVGLLDGVVLVVEAERVRNQVINRVKKGLVESGARLLGVVLNKRRQHVPEWLYRRL